MKELNNWGDVLLVSKALSSDVRLKIVKLLSRNKHMNLNELAGRLNITNGAMTAHIKLLNEAGIIEIQHSPGKRGSQKNCYLRENKFLIDIVKESENVKAYEIEIPVGTYSSYSATPTCGISTKSGIIGEVDDARYFDDPKRSKAGIIWFSKGFLEYRVPNYLKQNQTVTEIQISFEICSEAPGTCEDWPSDIHFFLNEKHLGFWTSPSDFGTLRGLYTPGWWFPNWNQYGLLKLLTINSEGSFIDGVKISDTTIGDIDVDYKSNIVFKIEAPESNGHSGGMTIFGKGFGNYNQDIRVRVVFEEVSGMQ